MFGPQFTGKKDEVFYNRNFYSALIREVSDTILTQLFGQRFFVHTANMNQCDRESSQLEN